MNPLIIIAILASTTGLATFLLFRTYRELQKVIKLTQASTRQAEYFRDRCNEYVDHLETANTAIEEANTLIRRLLKQNIKLKQELSSNYTIDESHTGELN